MRRKLEYPRIARLQIELHGHVLVCPGDTAVSSDESIFKATQNSLAGDIPLGGYLIYGCIQVTLQLSCSLQVSVLNFEL